MADIPLQLPNIGNALMAGSHAAYFGGKARLEADEEERRQAAQPFVQKAMTGDPAAMAQVATGDPKTAMVLTQVLGRADANQRAQLKSAADYTARAANAVLQADPAERPAIYQQMLEEGKRQGFDLSRMPPQYTPAIDGQLRFHRAQSKEVNDFLLKQEEERGKNARHATPQATQTPSMEPMPGGPVAPAGPVPGVPARVSEVPPPAAPPVQVAQAMPPPGFAQGQATAVNEPTGQSPGPLRPEGVTPGASPVGGAAPQQEPGLIWPTDPSLQGGVMMGHRAKPGAPLTAVEVNGHFQFKMPDGRMVFYKPHAERPPPVNYENDPAAPGRVRPIAGGPADTTSPNNPQGMTGDEFVKTLPPERAAQLKALYEGRMAMSPRLQASKDGKQLISDLMSAYPDDFDSIMNGQRQKTANEFAVGTAAKNITALNTAIQHLGEVHRLGSDLHNFEMPILNTVTNFAQQQTGDRRITDFETAKHAVVEEISKVFRGMGQSDAEIHAWESKINSSQSPAQLQGQIETITHLLNGRIDALGEQYKTGMGRSAPPLQILTPQSQATLDFVNSNKIAGRGAPAAPARAPTANSGVPAPPAGFRIVQ